MNKIELLAPAGNFSKFLTALQFGADDVYIGGKDFSLRAFSENFTREDIEKALQIAHKQGKKVYVAVNIFAKNSDVEPAARYFEFLSGIGADAVIITDPGLIETCGAAAPGLTMHLSTQANTLNYASVNFWVRQGIKRVILARELSVAELSEIREKVPESVELEAFVHGAMCISYSGRCLLSNYLNGRDSNRGECVQACRWKFGVREYEKGGNYLTAEEDERGTYLMNSKDLNMISHLAPIINAGVTSLKIEGRMKSEYYLATVINAYRRALDDFLENGDSYAKNPLYEKELRNTAHRAFTTAYAFGNNAQTVNYNDSQSQGNAVFAANVIGYDEEGGFAVIEMRNRFLKGDVLEVLSPGENFGKVIVAEKMEDEDGNPVDDAKLVQQKIRLFTSVRLVAGELLRRPVQA
ncbi:MAG: U32 family peptidase [Clostridia bacterium]|nr:U32 family peptidase [Clostridia bacterium]